MSDVKKSERVEKALRELGSAFIDATVHAQDAFALVAYVKALEGKVTELATDLERTRNERNAAQVQARREIHKEHRDYIAKLEAQIEAVAPADAQPVAWINSRDLQNIRDGKSRWAKAFTGVDGKPFEASPVFESAQSEGFRRDAWQPIETAPEGKLLVVAWLDKDDPENPERHTFDFIEDGGWARHNDDYDHFLCVAPPGSRGPSEDAPYTHWIELPEVPAALSQNAGEKDD